MRILFAIALAQLRQHRGRWLLLAAGIALIVAVPVTSAGLAADVRARSVVRTVTDLAPADRALFVTMEGDAPGVAGTRTDGVIRTELARLTDRPARRELMFRPLTVRGRQLVLAATDRLAAAVHVTSGRLPHRCTPRACEVVAIGAVPAAVAAAARDLGVDVVGTARRTDPQLLSGRLDPGRTPLLVADGVPSAGRLATLELFSRFYAWTADLDPQRVVALGVPAYLRLAGAVGDDIERRVGRSVFLRPDDALQAGDERATVSTRRFGLLGGLAAALLLGFAVVAAAGLRRETGLLVTVLRRRGATAGQVAGVVAGEAVAAGLAGTLLGGAVGAVAVAAVASGSGRSVGATVARALSDADLAAAILAGAAVLVVTAVLLWPEARARVVWRVLDLVALVCLGAAFLATDRGRSDLSGGSDPLVVALPVLAAVVGGLVATRLWAPAAQLVARVLPARAVAGRIGLLGLVRRPLRPGATVAFLTAAVASVVFAGAYRATLLANDADQAAFQVPLDATVTAAPGGPAVDTVVAARPGGAAHPVLRVPAAVTRLAGVVDAVGVVGVDGDALRAAHRWPRVTGSDRSPGALARALAVAPVPPAPVLPGRPRTVTLTIDRADPRTRVSLWVGLPSGREMLVPLRAQGTQLAGALPGAAGMRVLALGLDIDSDYLDRQQHNTGEGTTDQPTVSGTLTVRALRAGGRSVDPGWTGWGSALGTTTGTAAGLHIAYRLAGRPVIALPHFAATSTVLPVAVDPRTAADAHGGDLQVVLDGDAPVTARIVAVLPRLPTAGSTFLLADRAALTRVLDRVQPGRSPVEYWLTGPSEGLAAAGLTVTTRTAVEHDLDTDPIGRGARTLLVLVALLALAVAAVSLALLVVGERRDGAGELYAWEADGVRPRTLRRMLAVRLAAVAAIGVPAGVAAGLVLARVGTDLVAVDASGSTPTPPLAVTLGSVWTPAALLAGVGAGLLLGGLVVAASLRERYPVAAEADLR